jgi:hypothetical protein
MDRPSVRATSKLPWPERLARLRDAAFRDQVLSEGNGDAEARLPESARVIHRGFDRSTKWPTTRTTNPTPSATASRRSPQRRRRRHYGIRLRRPDASRRRGHDLHDPRALPVPERDRLRSEGHFAAVAETSVGRTHRCAVMRSSSHSGSQRDLVVAGQGSWRAQAAAAPLRTAANSGTRRVRLTSCRPAAVVRAGRLELPPLSGPGPTASDASIGFAAVLCAPPDQQLYEAASKA